MDGCIAQLLTEQVSELLWFLGKFPATRNYERPFI